MEKIVESVLNVPYEEPWFFIHFHKVNRIFKPLEHVALNNNNHQISIKKRSFTRWKIDGENLINKVENQGKISTLFSGESYIFQCSFSVQNETESLLFYWRGDEASKGHSPLPPGVDEYHPMERYWQWCESAIFFNCFDDNVVVLAGRENIFDKNKPHLFLIRGELPQEVHLYEVPCEHGSLRRKASFLLVCPLEKQFIYWHGGQANIGNEFLYHKLLENFEKSWIGFTVFTIQEKSENNSLFNKIVKGNKLDYVQKEINGPVKQSRMFYLNSITGDFAATEIKYPLRSINTVAPYPFLQSHLSIPGIFLLDVGEDIWLWIGKLKSNLSEPDVGQEMFKKDCKLSEELAQLYVKSKSKSLGISIAVKYVLAGEEPLEFKNIFPFWSS